MSGYPECTQEHEPDEDDLDFARETLGDSATDGEVHDLAVQRVVTRCKEGERCRQCGEPAPHGTPKAPQGMVWLCDSCDRDMEIALRHMP